MGGGPVQVVLVVVLAVLAVAVVWYVVSYNRFVTQRQRVQDAWAVIELELDRRHHLVPRLVGTVQAAIAHERAVLTRLDELRAAAVALGADPAKRDQLAAVEAEMEQLLHRVLALAEGAPTLRSQATFLGLQRELALTEDRIAAARRFYNLRVRDLNQRVGALPSSLIARRHGITPATYFDA
jgi:LemA protein